jgi:hypothetical protein
MCVCVCVCVCVGVCVCVCVCAHEHAIPGRQRRSSLQTEGGITCVIIHIAPPPGLAHPRETVMLKSPDTHLPSGAPYRPPSLQLRDAVRSLQVQTRPASARCFFASTTLLSCYRPRARVLSFIQAPQACPPGGMGKSDRDQTPPRDMVTILMQPRSRTPSRIHRR